jgi:hypothetical protein
MPRRATRIPLLQFEVICIPPQNGYIGRAVHLMQPRKPSPSSTRRQALSLFAGSLGTLLLAPYAFANIPFVYGKGIDGRDITSLAGPGVKFIATIFVATDCPISNRYLPLLARLAHEFAPRGVRLWLVYPNPGDTLAAVRAHQAQYPAASSLPQLLAPGTPFLAHAHAHVTPEAAIFHAGAVMSQPVLWHGRIDDRYLSFGTQRPAATRHDFADALNAVLAGKKPTPPAGPPVGCAIIPRT